MRKDQIPQDKNDDLYQNKFGKGLLKYVLDDNDNYTSGLSSGWNPEIIVLEQALEELNHEIEEKRKKVNNHEISPIAYFAAIKRMDLSVLAAYSGFMKWRVKRHLKPKVFDKLTNKILSKYADIFGISIDVLKKYDI